MPEVGPLGRNLIAPVMLAALALALTGCGNLAAASSQHPPAPPSADYSSPAASPDPSFACTVVTHNDDTAAVNQFIAANGFDDSHASAPQLSVTVTAGSEDAVVESVMVAGYDGSGREAGSTDVTIGQVVTAGQSMTFTGDLPWYQVSEYDSWGNPTVYTTGASTCQVVSWAHG
jgi:hypothetical protein